MEVIVVNKNFERLGIIDNASVIWSSRYYKTGEFELYMALTQDKLDLILNGYYIVRDDDEDNIGVIEKIHLENEPETGDMITVTGRFASGKVLGSRIVSQQTQLYGDLQDNIRNLVYINAINASNPKRNISFLELGNIDSSINEKIEMQITGANLLEKIEENCEANGLGFKMPLRNGKLYFEMYKGVDRSYNQTKNSWIVFCDEYDNLKKSEYDNDVSTYTNYAYVAGEGEGLSRKIVEVYNTSSEPSGIDRSEIWVDQRNISSNNEDITETELESQMKDEGLDKLASITVAFAGEVILKGFKYKEDFKLGDIVTIKKESWNGIYINARIIEVIESEDQDGKVITLTFGI